MTRSVGYKNRSLPPSTRVTHASQRKLYQHFCVLGGINPVPLSQDNACRYITFVSQKLAYTSIKQYINVVRIVHLEASHANPFQGSWHNYRHAAQRYTTNIRGRT